MRTALVLLFLFPFALTAQRYSASERTIRTLQDQRSLAAGKLVAFLRDSEPRNRSLAAIALGNIQDTTSLDALLPALRDRNERVRASAAWALGQLGHSAAQQPLLRRLSEEKQEGVVRRLVEALGKCGNDSALQALVALKETPALARARGEVALTVARFALRGITSDEAVPYCFRRLTDPQTGVRWRALYALWRSSPSVQVDRHIARYQNALRTLITDQSADVRMQLATLLGRSQSRSAFELLRSLARREIRDGEWRVRVQVVRALGAWGNREREAGALLASFLDIPNNHVRIAAMQSLRGLTREQLGTHTFTALRKKILSLANATLEPSVRGQAILTTAKLFPADFQFTSLLESPRVPLLLKADIVEAIGQMPSAGTFHLLLHLTVSDSVMIARTAWEAIPVFLRQKKFLDLQREDTSAQDLPAVMFRRIKASLLRDDMAITTAVAQAVMDSAFFSVLQSGGYEGEAIEELMLSYTRLSSPNDVEAMHAILDALGKYGGEKSVPVLERALNDPDRTVAQRARAALKYITGKEYPLVSTGRMPLFTDYDWKTLESLAKGERVRVRTNRGSFVLQLLPEHAPFSVLSFIKLVRKGFYDGLTFHRGVPNFVIQGGDPRGDGWGGPGYSLRSEWSLINYERGSVGLASAGKDTEGCQFFIIHSPQPHLDGRYTIFGRVVAGMEVVDAIQRGDVIRTMELMK